MNHFCFLNLDTPLFKEDITLDDIPKGSITIIDKEKYLNEKIFKIFKSLDLRILFVETFFKTPGEENNIHIDALGGDYTKLNWVFGGGDSKMTWYEPINKTRKPIFRTATNTIYILYQPEEVNKIESVTIKNPTLVQVGVPHNVTDITEDRLCVSIVFQDIKSFKRLSMSESIQRFKEYVF